MKSAMKKDIPVEVRREILVGPRGRRNTILCNPFKTERLIFYYDLLQADIPVVIKCTMLPKIQHVIGGLLYF